MLDGPISLTTATTLYPILYTLAMISFNNSTVIGVSKL